MHTLNDVELILKRSRYKKDMADFLLYIRNKTVTSTAEGNTLFYTADVVNFLQENGHNVISIAALYECRRETE